MQSLRFTSPYLAANRGFRWLRGNHHGHSTRSDGTDAPLTIVQSYEAAGYDYLALSEHDTFYSPADLQEQTQMCLIPAVEVTSVTGQTLMVLGAEVNLPAKLLTAKEIMDQTHEAGGLFVFDHPNWRPVPDYASDDLLNGMIGLNGIEIYCAVVERHRGEALATNRWDRLLAQGWHVYGHAADDQHERDDQFLAWNCVQWPSDEPVTWQGIVSALAKGRFFASTGVMIDTVTLSADGQQITVVSDADETRWIARDGVTIKKSAGGSSSLTLDEYTALAEKHLRPWPDFQLPPLEQQYVRVECLGCGRAAAWTQPFWLVS